MMLEQAIERMNAPTWAKSDRRRAWRNLMVAAINAGIAAGHISLEPLDESEFRFPFTFDGDVPAWANARGIGWGELRVHVAAWTTEGSEKWLGVGNAGFRAGEAVAWGWFERKEGKWLQNPGPMHGYMFRCRKLRISRLAEANVQPAGFNSEGRFFL